jgi:hypothetical protein
MSTLRALSTFAFLSICACATACSKDDAPPPPAPAATPTAASPVDSRALNQKVLPAPIRSAVASVAPSASAEPVDPKAALLGTWRFSGFDFTDPATKTMWSSLAGSAQAQVLGDASKATLIITPTELITRLGPDETREAYTIDLAVSDAGADEVTLKTKGGPKQIRFVDATRAVMRVAEPGKKDSPVVLFARLPAGAASAGAVVGPAPASVAPSGSTKK